jgi:hypothetical protein
MVTSVLSEAVGITMTTQHVCPITVCGMRALAGVERQVVGTTPVNPNVIQIQAASGISMETSAESAVAGTTTVPVSVLLLAVNGNHLDGASNRAAGIT